VEQLSAAVRNYNWGHQSFIADLQGRTPTGQPEAELWVGAHPGAPSRLLLSKTSLPDHIAADPDSALGERVAARFGELPFLVKVLAAARPLSLQTHPTKVQAMEGYERESAAGIALDAPNRIYRDTNHKPELICALTPFEAKSGFASLAQTRELFEPLGATALAPVLDLLHQTGTEQEVLERTLRWLLCESAQSQQALVAGAVEAAANAGSSPFAPAWGWVPRIAGWYPGDVGPVVSLLLNHVVLQPGQAMYLPAGNLHSYLGGCGVEVMANSDNVIRCGLTSKHVDVDELLAVVDATPIAVAIQAPVGPRHCYVTDVDEFVLERILVADDVEVAVGGPEIIVATAGDVVAIDSSGMTFPLGLGQALWVDASEVGYTLHGRGDVFRTTSVL